MRFPQNVLLPCQEGKRGTFLGKRSISGIHRRGKEKAAGAVCPLVSGSPYKADGDNPDPCHSL